MLHEALMALAGYTGGLFPDEGDKVPDYSFFVHPGEKILLNRILHIAKKYKKILLFSDKYLFVGSDKFIKGNGPTPNDRDLLPGVYLKTFCDAVHQVLQPYRQEIVSLERLLHQDPNQPLTRIVSRAERYLELLQVLNSMIQQIEDKRAHGAAILVIVHRHVSSGVEEVRSAVKHILRHCHITFYNQLSSWMVYGILHDNYKEFIIECTATDPQITSTSSAEFIDSSDSPEMLTPTAGSPEAKVCNYSVRMDMLPPYITPVVANKILFVGKTVLMFTRDCTNMVQKGVAVGKPFGVQSIWGTQEQVYIKKLQRLHNMRSFNIARFEETIEEFRLYVTRYLWSLTVESADLFAQLQLVKDLFLLGRGELFQEFIRQADPMLHHAPTSHARRDINNALHIAAQKMLRSDDTSMDNFYLVIPAKDEDVSSKSKENGWQLLKLKYKVPWKLQLVFTPPVLENYNTLFRFLLRVKRTQIELHTVWSLHTQNKSRKVDAHTRSAWQLRNNLMFLVDNLQYYLQVDVLESQCTILNATVRSTQDFEVLQRALAIFQTNVLSQAFLLEVHSPVQVAIQRILSLSEQFCGAGGLPDGPQLKDMLQEYSRLVSCLLQLLGSLRALPCGPHLSQLLLRLDYNRWISAQQGEFED